jgi:hypothetical protein
MIERKFNVGDWAKNVKGDYRFIEAFNEHTGECKIVWCYESMAQVGKFVQGSVWISQDKLYPVTFEPDYVHYKDDYIELALLTHDKELFYKVMEANEDNE